jgi:hypothetical protein
MNQEKLPTQNFIHALISERLSIKSQCVVDYNSQAFWEHLYALHRYHLGNSLYYGIIAQHFPCHSKEFSLPFVPADLFKQYELRSIPVREIYRTLESSGTSKQSPSKIFLDRTNSRHQQIGLASLFTFFTGLTRPNILIVDTPSTASRKSAFSARKAGILGFSSLCRKSYYALKDDYTIDYREIEAAFCSSDQILVFGFTFIAYQYLLSKPNGFPLVPKNSKIVFLHGGGWKKLNSISITSTEFNKLVLQQTGISQTINYYGMVEQTGSLFFECPHGFMHTNYIGSIIPRNIDNLKPDFSIGDHLRVAQVLSALPSSYPGHSILTDDLVSIPFPVNQCTCGLKGLSFRIHGRIPNSEPRGCSDTHEKV